MIILIVHFLLLRITKIYIKQLRIKKLFWSLALCCSSWHAYAIKVAIETPTKKGLMKIFIVSNLHGKLSRTNVTNINEINDIFKNGCIYYDIFIEKNNQYIKNENNESSGIIYMPINYLINGQVIDLFVIHIMEIKVIYLTWKEI